MHKKISRCIQFKVTFLCFQIGDECVQQVIIEHGGGNQTYSRDLSDTFSLEVNQSLIYSFTMYLKLADGYEMVYWNGELDLTSTPATDGINFLTASI